MLGAGLGATFCIVVHKLMLSAGLFPTFNTAAGLLSFVGLKAVSLVTSRLSWWPGGDTPLTAQE